MSRFPFRCSKLHRVVPVLMALWIAIAADAGEPKAKTPPGDQAPTKAPWRSVRLNRLVCSSADFSSVGPVNYELTLDRVDFHDATMLWHFTATTPKKRGTDEFFRSTTKLLNGQGQAVSLLGSSAAYRKNPDGGEYYTVDCPEGEKKAFWLQFPLPKEEWTYHTLRFGKANMQVPEMTVHLPFRKPDPDAKAKDDERADDAVAEFTIDPKLNRPIVTSVKRDFGVPHPYLILVEKIEVMAVGDLRMHLKCGNAGKTALHDAVAIDLVGKGSHLRDPSGQFKYPLIGSSLGTTFEGVFWNVPPQETKSFWLEFKGPFQGGTRFVLQFEGAMGIPAIPLVLPPAKKKKS